MTQKHLILGGARSGKSQFAEQCVIELAANDDTPLIFIATATADDEEMQARIQHHQRRRDARWSLIEAPVKLASAVASSAPQATILIDCFTLWLSNCLHQGCWKEQRNAFLELLEKEQQRNIVMVSNEVGSGVVPLGELSRQFVDESGWLHQEVARHSNKVSLVCAGLPLTLKA